MSSPANDEITRLLQEWSNGSRDALARLLEVVYPELRRIAARHVRSERSGHTLQPTALVSEAYIRLVQHPGRQWQGRAHFFAVAAHVVRGVLVDHARARRRLKRGSGHLPVELTDNIAATAAAPVDLLDLDNALCALESIDPEGGRIVELRYFAGLSIEETAETMGLSTGTVKRGWVAAKTFVRRHLDGHPPA